MFFISVYMLLFLFFFFIRSDSYFDYCWRCFCSECSVEARTKYSTFVILCITLLHVSFASLRFFVSKCHRLRECIIVETVKSLTGRDTIYIYGFRFAMLPYTWILMQNTRIHLPWQKTHRDIYALSKS